jgi:hypothetical protein
MATAHGQVGSATTILRQVDRLRTSNTACSSSHPWNFYKSKPSVTLSGKSILERGKNLKSFSSKFNRKESRKPATDCTNKREDRSGRAAQHTQRSPGPSPPPLSTQTGASSSLLALPYATGHPHRAGLVFRKGKKECEGDPSRSIGGSWCKNIQSARHALTSPPLEISSRTETFHSSGGVRDGKLCVKLCQFRWGLSPPVAGFSDVGRRLLKEIIWLVPCAPAGWGVRTGCQTDKTYMSSIRWACAFGSVPLRAIPNSSFFFEKKSHP